MSFAQAINQTKKFTTTENGGLTLETSNNALVDLFFQIGASRQKEDNQIVELVQSAIVEQGSLSDVMRVLFWARDVRGGAGERRAFRVAIQSLLKTNKEAVLSVIPHIPTYGRWDDLLVPEFLDHPEAFVVVAHTIEAGLSAKNGLCAKWMPRQGKVAHQLRNYFGFSPKHWRKTLVELTKVVETQMCKQQWGDINYGHVPSVAAARYNKAFIRNDYDRYAEYKAGLVAGTEKINAAAIFPHDIVRTIMNGGDDTVAEAQWNALENFLGDSKVIPVVDVSGSMTTAFVSGSIRAIDVAVGLGLYCATKNEGPFHGVWCNFSESSRVRHLVGGSLKNKINALYSDREWGMSTNLESAFDSILEVAVQNDLPADQMPECVVIFSDMEFNSCVRGRAKDMIEAKYQRAGYSMPRVVFWNITGRSGKNSPVTYTEEGYALVSGFSPAIMKTIVAGLKNPDSFDPYNIMRSVIDNSRYDPVAVG